MPSVDLVFDEVGPFTHTVASTVSGNTTLRAYGGGGGGGYYYSGYGGAGGGGGGFGFGEFTLQGGTELEGEVGDGGIGGEDFLGQLATAGQGSFVQDSLLSGSLAHVAGDGGHGGGYYYDLGLGGGYDVSGSAGVSYGGFDGGDGNGSASPAYGSGGGASGSMGGVGGDGGSFYRWSPGIPASEDGGIGGAGATYLPSYSPAGDGEQPGGGGGGGSGAYPHGGAGAKGRVTITYNVDDSPSFQAAWAAGSNVLIH